MAIISATADVNGSRVVVQLSAWADPETTIYRVVGGERTALRAANPVRLSGGVALVSDYEVPPNVPVSYEAADATGALTYGTTKLVLDIEQTWLKLPIYPSLNTIVHLAEPPSLERQRRQSVFQVLGARTPIVMSDVRSATTGQLSFITLNDDEANRLRAALEMSAVVLLQTPSGFGSRYISIGDITENFVYPKFGLQTRRWDCAFIEVASPLGDVTGDPYSTYQTLMDTYPTYGDLLQGEADYLDLLGGINPALLTPIPDPAPEPEPDPDPPPDPDPEPPPVEGEDDIMALGVVYSADWPTTAPKRAAGTYTAYCDGTNDEVQINAIIDAVAAYGRGEVYLAGKDFSIGNSIRLKTGIYLRGGGIGTVIKASGNFGKGMIELFDESIHATAVSDLTLNGNGREVHGFKYSLPTRVPPDPLAPPPPFTSVPNTDPDPAATIRNVYIQYMGSSTFAGHAMWMIGGRNRAGKFSDIRILDCKGCGVFVDKGVDSHYTNIEVGTSGKNGPAASNSSTTPVGHGFFISQGDNNMFTACKAWYSRATGFYVRGTRNGFTNCQAQDNYSNGYEITFGKNSFASCHADSNGSAKGANSAGTAGFRVAANLVAITGCESYDKAEADTDWQQQYGFQFTSAASDCRIGECITYGNVASVSGTPGEGTTVDIASLAGT